MHSDVYVARRIDNMEAALNLFQSSAHRFSLYKSAWVFLQALPGKLYNSIFLEITNGNLRSRLVVELLFLVVGYKYDAETNLQSTFSD